MNYHISPLRNTVVFALETGAYLVISHLKPGSVLVHAGNLALAQG